MSDPFRNVRLLSMSPELQESIRAVGEGLPPLRQRLDKNERALAKLPAFSWDQPDRRPTRRDTARLRAARQSIVDAMARDLERLSTALRRAHVAAGLFAVREQNFDVAEQLLHVEQEFWHFGRLHATCIGTEWAITQLDPFLDALRPEDRIEVIAMTRWVRSVLAQVRPQITALSGFREGDGTRVADELREELDRVVARTDGVFDVQLSYAGDIKRRRDAGDVDAIEAVVLLLTRMGDGPVEPGLAGRLRRAWRALSRRFGDRAMHACHLLGAVDTTWRSEVGTMKESISFYSGTTEGQNQRRDTQELFSLGPHARRRGDPN